MVLISCKTSHKIGSYLRPPHNSYTKLTVQIRITTRVNLARSLSVVCALVLMAFPFPSRADQNKSEPSGIKPYPLDRCIVTGEKLGSHGPPFAFTNATQEFKLCCKECLSDFNKNPAKYARKRNRSRKLPK